MRAQGGYTLVELLVVMFITLLILIAISSFGRDIFSLNGSISDGLNAEDEARHALAVMTSEIRTAAQSNVGAYPIDSAGDTSFSFYSNVDADALVEKVRYFLSGTTLERGVTKPSGSPLSYNSANEKITELVHDVANGATPIFTYYDGDYDGTTDPLTQPVTLSDVRLVGITITVDHDPNRPPAPATLTTKVTLRNLKDNL